MAEKSNRLYFENPYQVEFEAHVIKKTSHDGKPAVVLDQTFFYPEGGGQPADKGTINGIQVIHVLEEDEQIMHVLKEDITSDFVKGEIDWGRRFDHMQQHAGQHILSQCFVRIFEAKTLSFHLGEKLSTLEIDMRKITEEEVEKVEKLANDIVFQDREIKSQFLGEEGIQSVPLRKPSQKKGLIRVVEVSGFDCTACGGTHPRRTGEIGMVKILRWERIRNNIRLEFISGGRALQDYTRKHRDLRQLSNQLTVDESEVTASFEKLMYELKAQKSKARKMQENLIQYEAEEVIQGAEEKIVKKIFTERTPEEIRLLVLSIIKKGEFVVLFGLKGEARAHVFLACSESFDLDMRELVPVVASLIDGRGGGRPGLIEIAGEKISNLDKALEKANEIVNQKLGGPQLLVS
ncbi:MAG: DHHA1 domain-containing protein [Candidatus Aminicenantes bacterium]|nr:DHHA1 domain-containing protein [Candidatus Aminicenantes bacterium]MDH5383360.1 DHHA1 domain-containing protein [Candidatus Aminicenantes bacterium]MDH5742004.1 DHHA1 domain-containing protein [Candidatus Aminicenantes bacterium]